MPEDLELVPGHIYRRRAIHESLGGQRQGGISTPDGRRVVLIFTGESGSIYGYSDGFQEDGTFWYTGEGQIGDMAFIRGNLAIRDHLENGRTLHLFEQAYRAHVRYIGKAEYVGHHVTIAPDRNGTARQVIVFELGLLPELSPSEEIETNPHVSGEVNLRKLTLKQLRTAAIKASSNQTSARQRNVSVRLRSQAIKLYVRKRAAGVCELCHQPAPFKTVKGEPYLEPHHTTRLADGGPDHPRCVAAICPNCHRRIHHGEDGDMLNQKLSDLLGKLEMEES